MLRFRIAAFLLIASLAFADEIQFSGIVTGFVLDASSSSIRPILGVPGAAMLGSPVAQDIDAAEIASHIRIAERESGVDPHFRHFKSRPGYLE